MGARRIAIIGSVNMDLVARVDHAPAPNENVFGHGFRTIPGGKGANQAVAVARLGAQAVFIGKVGDDAFGPPLLDNLRREGVDVAHVGVARGAASGTAMILVDGQGRNSIIICSGANALLTPADADALTGTLRAVDAIVMQLETPVPTVAHVIRRAAEWRVPVVLDAGPPCSEPPAEFFAVDVLTPNEAETAALLGRSLCTAEQAEAAGKELLARGVGMAVLKLGDKGALLVAHEETLLLPAHRVKVVDSTAAGDAFTGALAVRLAEGAPPADALRWANAAGALACTRHGAQPSMPSRDEVAALL